jgi:hypothetical protein
VDRLANPTPPPVKGRRHFFEKKPLTNGRTGHIITSLTTEQEKPKRKRSSLLSISSKRAAGGGRAAADGR